MSSPSPVRGDVLEQAVALRALGLEWAAIAQKIGNQIGKPVTPDQVTAAVRRHNQAAGIGKENHGSPQEAAAETPAGRVRPLQTVEAISQGLGAKQAPAQHAPQAATGRVERSQVDPVVRSQVDHAPQAPAIHTSKTDGRESGVWESNPSDRFGRPTPDLSANPAPASVAPAVHTSKTRAEAYLVVPDLQAPFQAHGALEFCERVRREFGVHRDNILFAGDEVDNFHGKGADKAPDPDAEHTPRQELRAAKEELQRWYAWTGGRARLAFSNHGTRYERRAAEANISSDWMKLYRDVLEAPIDWVWKDRWIIPASKQPFVLEHGHEGKPGTEAKVLENGYSTVHGHFTKAITVWVTNHLGRRLWGQCAAALIDYDTYAFKYARKYPRRPDNGATVILDGGRIPLFVPMES